MNTTVKYNHISVAKGIGIIMVVLAHSFANPNYLTNFICLFHMPLFFFLSGYCFKDKYVKSKRQFLKRSIRSLYIPFVITNLIFIFLHNVFFDLNIYNDVYGFMGNVSKRYDTEDYLQQIIYTFRFMGQEQLLGGFWFLHSLFFARLIFLSMKYGESKFGNKLYKQIFQILFVLGMTIFCLLGLRIPGLFGSKEVFGAMLIWIGYVFKQFESSISSYSSVLFVISLSVCLVYAIYRPLYYNSNPLNIARVDYIIPCVAGCLMTYYACSSIWLREQISLIYVGSHTLIILALHFLSFKFTSLAYIIYYGLDIKLLAQFAVLTDSPRLLCIPYLLGGVIIPLVLRCTYKKIYESIILCVRRTGRVG